MREPAMAKITVDITEVNAEVLAQLAKHFTYLDAQTLSDRLKTYPDGRTEADRMMQAVAALRRGLAKAGFEPA
jgi:hypothetical protein